SKLTMLDYLSMFLLTPPQPTSTLFPYTTLFRSARDRRAEDGEIRTHTHLHRNERAPHGEEIAHDARAGARAGDAFRALRAQAPRSEEHTSNSSHVSISYAVFCLKKKNIKMQLMI